MTLPPQNLGAIELVRLLVRVGQKTLGYSTRPAKMAGKINSVFNSPVTVATRHTCAGSGRDILNDRISGIAGPGLPWPTPRVPTFAKLRKSVSTRSFAKVWCFGLAYQYS